ncbi:hypothetical protein EVAR_16689_1 [Eumeta japonica]|uniref:Uncharacterized protein n=1 Tax=Eumeta variegata TaxID=151549 RepID=A0A4C1V4A7_EUMVA|nr:hypothetical protein EVAR_16689_1 [Eumeta japonica]
MQFVSRPGPRQLPYAHRSRNGNIIVYMYRSGDRAAFFQVRDDKFILRPIPGRNDSADVSRFVVSARLIDFDECDLLRSGIVSYRGRDFKVVSS